MATSRSSVRDRGGDVSLLEHLDRSQANCLNEAAAHSIKHILPSGPQSSHSDQFLESDADEQLLLNIQFNQKVRIKSLKIKSKVKAQGPKEIRLYINQPSLGFENVEGDLKAIQTLELSEEDISLGNSIALLAHRFQKVESLHMFVVSNQGDEETTRIDSIDFFGETQGTVMKDLSGLNRTEED